MFTKQITLVNCEGNFSTGECKNVLTAVY